jgi:hypothetical protein
MTSLLILSGVVGIMLFFSVAVAPTIFKVLPQEWASAYVRKFFPKYYAVLGAATLLAALLTADHTTRWVAGVCSALFVVSLLVLTPAVNRATDQGKKRLFGWLHGLSILVNMGQLVALLVVLWQAH